MKKVRRIIRVKGIVQGVGFRPFIYRLAISYDLHGWVNNSSEGVIIDIEGLCEDIDNFVQDIKSEAPPLANIDGLSIKELPLKAYESFNIEKSRDDSDIITLISPDIAICSKCKQEISDIHNYRYHYPFTNCTDCGPRYSIITDLPYDRPKTTMDSFDMCDKCKEEYHDPLNRRFHAQPVACPECGPELCLTDNQGNKINVDDPLKETVELLKRGKIVAIKGLGGFHLTCDAFNQSTIRELRKRKRRPDKPLALMMRDLDIVKEYCYLTPEEEEILIGIRKPILLLERKLLDRKENSGSNIETDIEIDIETDMEIDREIDREKDKEIDRDIQLSSDLSPDNKRIGVMLPYTPLHELLFHTFEERPGKVMPEIIRKNKKRKFLNIKKTSEDNLKALVMTSANISDLPLEYTNQGAQKNLNKIGDYFLLHNRDIKVPVDDSVSQILLAKERLIRRARGYAPLAIKFPGLKESLACGSYLKNTIALAKGDYIFLSQHLGDISNLESYQYYKKLIAHLKKIYKIKPIIIAYDYHAGYLSSQFAQIQQGKKLRVQHHHAHIVSCMVDNEISEKVIGLAYDGTGLGTDACIWGGEFLICDYSGFKRVGQLKYIKMPGGDKVVKEPWRMAVSYLYHTYGYNLELIQKMIAIEDNRIKNEKQVNEEKKDEMQIHQNKIEEEQITGIIRLLEADLNVPQTSSMGRLFDAVASLLGLGNYISYQAQAAIKLEAAASNIVDTAIEAGSKADGNSGTLIESESKDFANTESKGDRNDCIISTSKVYKSYNYQIESNEDYFIVNTLPIIRDIVKDIESGISRELIAGKFHNTVIDFSVSVCELIRVKYKIVAVALSGGVFQNKLILEGIYKRLKEREFKVYIHSKIPCNDGGLSVGQLVIANYIKN